MEGRIGVLSHMMIGGRINIILDMPHIILNVNSVGIIFPLLLHLPYIALNDVEMMHSLSEEERNTHDHLKRSVYIADLNSRLIESIKNIVLMDVDKKHTVTEKQKMTKK